MSNIQQVTGLLKYTYGLVPIIAGLDKFFNILTDWGAYLSPELMNVMPLDPTTLMSIVGFVEIIAGALVFFRTKLGSLVVSGWLAMIALTLISSGIFLDVAIRDLVMAIGAFSLCKLSAAPPQKKN